MRSEVVVTLSLALALALGVAPLLAQSTTSGSLQGTVKDTDGGMLPGVSVTATSAALVAGKMVTFTDERGAFRFPSLPPGTYTLEVELSGFRTLRQEGIRLGLGQALSLAITMELAGAVEEVTVTGDAPLVSVVSNTVSNNLTQDFIERQPLPRDVNQLINYTPGVNNDRAFGATQENANAYNLDGMSVSDPGSGQHWLLPNLDWLKEVQVMGLGAAAEYGGFTGAMLNMVTKSGGNEVSGDIRAYYTGGSLTSDNAPEGFKYTSEKESDYDLSVAVGGAFAKDKLWYFVSGEEVRTKTKPFLSSDVPAAERKTEKTDLSRYMAKFSIQANPSNTIVILGSYDGKYVDYRGLSDVRLASAATKQESPNITGSLRWESIVNASNFASINITAFKGTDDRLPYHGNRPGRQDDYTGYYWDNNAFTLKQDKTRLAADLAWNLFAEGLFGGDSHAFKFGLSYEDASHTEKRTRNGGFTYYDDSSYCGSVAAYFADPFCGVYSSDRGDEINLQGVQKGIHLFAQDSLKWGNLTVNLGARYTKYTAGFDNGKSDVYEVDAIAPRLGIVYDLFGNARSAVKAHYGRYYAGMFTYMYDREASGQAFTPYEIWDYNFSTGQFDKLVRRTPNSAAMDSDISHPYIDQYLLSFEQQLGRDMSLGFDFTYRKDFDIIAMVNVNDDYDALTAPNNPLTGGSTPFFDLLSNPQFVLSNPDQAYRKYRSYTARFEKRYSHGWSARASVVWADLKGNAFASNSYVSEWADRNGQVNADGKLPGFSEWEVKLSGSVDLPWGIEGSAYYTFLSGEYWTPYVRVRGLYKNDRTNVYMEKRGSRQLDDRHLVDLRLLKAFTFGKGLKLSVFADGFNIFNSNTVTGVDARWGEYRYNYRDHPAGSTWRPRAAFGAPTEVESPREVRLGVKLSF
ncbi:MAG TPA: TonB-dependent receptor [Thermoanaerobaculaceae bacterium]|nr:TonB-dependent receptor [Thermoanaerobaculaceae bacterium]HRS16313.1 TonB-dependent receptor [Thermoanaerobaculaceae bacterium]